MIISDKEKRTTAVHEAGHALVARFVGAEADPVHKVTIIPRGRALGVTQQLPPEDRLNMTREFAQNQIAILMGGRVAEEIVFGQKTTGAGNDIERATELARTMVCEWGMSDKFGPLNFSGGKQEVFLGRDFSRSDRHSEDTAQRIDAEIRRIVIEQYERAMAILTEHRKELKQIAEALLEYETLDGDDIDTLLRGGKLDAPDRRRSAQEEGHRRRAPPSEDEARSKRPSILPPARCKKDPSPEPALSRRRRAQLRAARHGRGQRHARLVLRRRRVSRHRRAAVAHGRQLVADGADILDVGGEADQPARARRSPRPRSCARAAGGRAARRRRRDRSRSTRPRPRSRAPRSPPAPRIVNDVSGGLFDPEMAADDRGARRAPTSCGHLRGATLARGVRRRGRAGVVARGRRRARARGSPRCRPACASARWVDPGLGFGKGADPDGNLALLRHAGDLGAQRSAARSSSGRAASDSSRRSLGRARRRAASSRWTPRRSPPASRRSRAGAHVVRVHNVALLKAALDRVHQIVGRAASRGGPCRIAP